MKKNPQPIPSPDQQEKPKARVPFFAQKLSRETLRTISGGDDDKVPPQEVKTKV